MAESGVAEKKNRLSRWERLERDVKAWWQGYPSPGDVATALQQLSLMLAVGITVPNALDILSTDAEHPKLRQAFDDIADKVGMKGWSFSQATACHPKIFTDGSVLMFKAGEESGDFAARLERAAELLERKQQLIKKVKSSLSGPLMNVGMCALVTWLLARWVLPKFVDMYDNMDVALPLISRVVIGAVWLLNHPITIIVVVGSAVICWIFRSELRELLFSFGLRFQFTRSLLGNILCVQFMDIMASIHRDGIPITRGLDMLEKTAPFKLYRSHIEEVGERLRMCGSLAESVDAVPYFPPLLGAMLMVGEEVGRLADALRRACDFLEMQNEMMLTQAVNLLEPALLAIMGIVMGTTCVGLFLPIYGMLDKVS